MLLIITLAEHDVHPKREIFLVGDPQRDSAVLLNHLRNGICTGTMAFESVVGCHATFFSGALQALPDVNFQSKSIVDFIGEMEGVLHSASPELGLRHLCLGVDGSTFDPVVNQLGFFDLTFLQHMTEIDLRMVRIKRVERKRFTTVTPFRVREASSKTTLISTVSGFGASSRCRSARSSECSIPEAITRRTVNRSSIF